ncbi:MAG: hypothetical protein KDA91_25345 [Planctomycetaceae bacterium]|nr:hypothetical protein [Planctomycetaceae bacterium]
MQFDPSTGTLTLLGVVSSYYQKQLAQEAVRDLEQVSSFLNRLEVRSRISHPNLAVGLGTTAKPKTDGESL